MAETAGFADTEKTTLSQACKTVWVEGTFKRQLAVIMLAFLGLITLFYFGRILVFTPSDAAVIGAIGAAIGPVYSALATMVVSFAGLAFGLDAWAKQIQGGRP